MGIVVLPGNENSTKCLLFKPFWSDSNGFQSEPNVNVTKAVGVY